MNIRQRKSLEYYENLINFERNTKEFDFSGRFHKHLMDFRDH